MKAAVKFTLITLLTCAAVILGVLSMRGKSDSASPPEDVEMVSLLRTISFTDYSNAGKLLETCRGVWDISRADEAGARLDLIGNETKDPKVKLYVGIKLVERAAALDADATWALLLGSKSANRNAWLEGYFTGAILTRDQFTARVETLNSEEAKRAALTGFLQPVIHVKKLESYDFSILSVVPMEQRKALIPVLLMRSGVADETISPAEKIARFSECARCLATLAVSEVISLGDFSEFLTNHFPGDAMKTLTFSMDEAQTAGITLDEEDLKTLIPKAAAVDPQGTLMRILDLDEEKFNSKRYLTQVAISAWLKRDAVAATAWLNENVSKVDAKVMDGAMAGKTVYYTQQKDFKASWDGVRSIQDPALRRKAEGEVWQAERVIVRQAAAKDPVGLIEAIASGKSQHAHYWIEEAMTVWIKQAPEKASAWYQEHWNLLAPEAGQYVAVAYARHAIRAKDAQSATAWLEFVKDSKLRENITAAIQKIPGSNH